MKIHYVYLEQYKQLKDFSISFSTPSPLLGGVSIKFLIGRNGAGKSSLMEAIGLILSRTISGSEPGFGFELVYSLQRGEDEETYIVLKSIDHGGWWTVEVREGATIEVARQAMPYTGEFRTSYWMHPNCIFSTASGPTNTMGKALLEAPLNVLKREYYEEKQYNTPDTKRLYQIETDMKRLVYDPKFMLFDTTNAKLVLLALVATRPTQRSERTRYNLLRRVLFSVLPCFVPVAFSLVVDENRFQAFQKRRERFRQKELDRFMELFEMQGGNDQIARGFRYQEDGSSPVPYRTYTYTLSRQAEKQHEFSYACEEATRRFDPLSFLAALHAAKQAGLLLDAHLFFKHADSDVLLDEDSLSDGEFMWLTRMGLILLARAEGARNSLFLMDEPDVFLNESWTSKFVRMIDLLLKNEAEEEGERKTCYAPLEIFVATHSSLILTDALKEQTYHLTKTIERSKEEGVDQETRVLIRAEEGAFHTFGADRGEITEHLFAQNNRVGSYSQRQVIRAIGAKTFERKKIEKLMDQTGPGYLGFQLQDYYYAHVETDLDREEE